MVWEFLGKIFDVVVSVNELRVMKFGDFEMVFEGDREVDNFLEAAKNPLEMLLDSGIAASYSRLREPVRFAMASVEVAEVDCSNLVPHDSLERTVDVEDLATSFFVRVTLALGWISDIESFVRDLFPMNWRLAFGVFWK